jgi:hypothetical protein
MNDKGVTNITVKLVGGAAVDEMPLNFYEYLRSVYLHPHPLQPVSENKKMALFPGSYAIGNGTHWLKPFLLFKFIVGVG